VTLATSGTTQTRAVTANAERIRNALKFAELTTKRSA
jgi:hypothetical protein